MDLREVREHASGRHPWEVARANAIVDIVARHRTRFSSVLDYGCGDGFTGTAVQSKFDVPVLVGVDVHLPQDRCGIQQTQRGTIELMQDDLGLGTRRFDLALLCDVIEHVEDDTELLSSVSRRWLAPAGLVLVTVPAFQTLFSEHDRMLRHYRRYKLQELRATLGRAALRVVDAGYLFSSLLPVRAFAKVREALLGPMPLQGFGVGQWRGSKPLTSVVTGALTLDNHVLLKLREFGLRLPGLTAWALCTTP